MFFLAIREDRTRGGRSTYQCSYTLPTALLGNPSGGQNHSNSSGDLLGLPTQRSTQMPSADPHVKLEVADVGANAGPGLATPPIGHLGAPQPPLNSGCWPSEKPAVPSLLQVGLIVILFLILASSFIIILYDSV